MNFLQKGEDDMRFVEIELTFLVCWETKGEKKGMDRVKERDKEEVDKMNEN